MIVRRVNPFLDNSFGVTYSNVEFPNITRLRLLRPICSILVRIVQNLIRFLVSCVIVESPLFGCTPYCYISRLPSTIRRTRLNSAMDKLAVVSFAILHLSCSGSVPESLNCDSKGVNLYRAIGCAKQGEGCDAYKSCEYKPPVGYCMYQGHKIESGQNAKTIVQDSSCNFGCICIAGPNTTGEFICASGRCGFELHGAKSDCYLKYSLDKCCSSQPPVCGKSDVTCTVGETVYKEGQRFSPLDRCLTCICTKDFKGDFTGPSCQPTPCDVEVRHGEQLAKNCAPLYFKSDRKLEPLCCPVNFICPSGTDVADQEPQPDGVCRYGEKQYASGAVIRTRTNRFGADRAVTCRCEAPPLLTCTMSY